MYNTIKSKSSISGADICLQSLLNIRSCSLTSLFVSDDDELLSKDHSDPISYNYFKSGKSVIASRNYVVTSLTLKKAYTYS